MDIKIGDRIGTLEIISLPFLVLEPNGKNSLYRVKCFCRKCNKEYLIRIYELKSRKSCKCNKRIYTVNEKFFDDWNYDSAYVLGMLTADGNVRDTSIRFDLHEQDTCILNYIKNAMDFTGDVKFVNRKSEWKGVIKDKRKCQLTIWSRRLIDRLAILGVTPRKTGNEVLPDIPDDFFYSYLLGLSDGDANMYIAVDKKRKRHREWLKYTLCSANKSFLEDIRHKNANVGSIHSSKKSPNCYTWVLGHHDSIRLGHLMYSNNSQFCLQRKKDKWLYFTGKEKIYNG